jgi:pilus assembly protein CpaB
MNRNRMLLLAVAALALSGIITFLVFRLVQSRLQPPEQTTQILVAAEKLPLGLRLTANSIRLAPWPKAMPLEGIFADPNEVINRGVIVAMLPNEPILESKLAPREAGAGLTPAIPDGMRAISVKVNDVIGVAGFVLPGTHVDVIMTGTPKQNDDVVSRTILENVQVLAAGQNVEQDSNGKPQNVQVVTLLVTPEQAQDVALASLDNRIQLSLRNPLDQEQKEPQAVQRTSLFYPGKDLHIEQNPAPKEAPKTVKATKPKPTAPVHAAVPPPLAQPQVHIVEIILGSKKEATTFKEIQP